MICKKLITSDENFSKSLVQTKNTADQVEKVG